MDTTLLNKKDMETKQTAVEWLIEMLIDNKYLLKDAEHLFEKAKQMEKEQIMEAWDMGDHCIDLPDGGYEQKYKSAEQYYNETYSK